MIFFNEVRRPYRKSDMAKLMSKKTREIVQTTAVLVVAVLFIVFYIIYPLVMIPRMTARPDRQKFEDRNFHPANDPAIFVAAGLAPDTFLVVSDDNIHLAALHFDSEASKSKKKGTVILLHPDDTDRTFLSDYVLPFLDSGFSVVIYDQRASGLTEGRYHSAGNLEAGDLVEMISYLSLRGKLLHPVIIVGFGTGADAGIIAAQNEKRISAVIAVDPFLTLSDWIIERKAKSGGLSIPFYRAVYLWWYQKLSGYPLDRTGLEDMNPVGSKTIIMADAAKLNSPEVSRLKEISSSNFLILEPKAESGSILRAKILDAVSTTAGGGS